MVYARPFLVGLVMLAAAGLALALAPRVKMADQGPKIDLEAMIPAEFGEWKLENANAPYVDGLNLAVWFEKLYNQTVSRNYINGKGDRIMLSVVYGGDQGFSSQIHLPEGCYPAQGFQIKNLSRGVVSFAWGELPVMKLVATRGQRIEPITYWAMIGESSVRGGLERALARYKYGLTGEIPYGIVVRVSILSADESQAYRIEEQFVRDMLGGMRAEYRKFLAGAGHGALAGKDAAPDARGMWQ